MTINRMNKHTGTIESHFDDSTPVLSMSHLPSRSNQANESYHYGSPDYRVETLIILA